jgi:hypothetical protein
MMCLVAATSAFMPEQIAFVAYAAPAIGPSSSSRRMAGCGVIEEVREQWAFPALWVRTSLGRRGGQPTRMSTVSWPPIRDPSAF